MDRRQRKTRDAVFEAFGALLTKKSYHQITVREIIEAANVGRTTFYAHFPTKDDLLREMCVDLFDHVFSASPNPEGDHDFSAVHPDPTAAITHLLYHLRENDRHLIGILRRDSNTPFLGFFREYFDAFIGRRLVAASPRRENAKIPPDFLRRHLSATFVNLVQWWIEKDMAATPEELTAVYIAVTLNME